MAWIETIAPAHADGELRALYERIAGARGGVADVHLVQSLNAKALAAHFELYKAIMFQPSPLSRSAREQLAVAVSQANGCPYCVAHHQAAVDQLPPGERLPAEVLDWAQRLARAPERSRAEDLDVLRRAGFDERAVLDAVLTVAYFNYVNRLVLALGATLEPGFEQTCRPELAEPGRGGEGSR